MAMVESTEFYRTGNTDPSKQSSIPVTWENNVGLYNRQLIWQAT